MNKIESILSERDDVYGTFEKVSRLYTNLTTSVEGADVLLDYKVKCSIDMIMMKIARIVSGDQYYRDNWADIAGYAMLIVNSIDAMEEDNDTISIYEDEEDEN